jgi:CRISPR-associated protein Cmr3
VAGGRDQKPAEALPFWRAEATIAWLAEHGCQPVSRKEDELGWKGLARQRRIHLEVERDTQAVKKGMLFATEGLEFGDRAAERGICSRITYVDGEQWAELEPMAPLGGEQRLAYWSEVEVEWPAAPDWLVGEELVRLQLVTPGYFGEGWRPQWLAPGDAGTAVPDLEGLELSLVAAVVPRPVAQSGWDLTKPGGRSQKKTRFLAPAGSVYFCRVRKGDARRLWMRSICDDEQARRDGFGLVLCGVWQWRQD